MGHISLRDSMKGSWRKGSFIGNLKDILRLWKWKCASIGFTLLGYMEWHFP
jgi:hypothetical protein